MRFGSVHVNFVILGAGAVGSVLGGHLYRSGHDVLLVGRPGHVGAIRDSGLEITGAMSFHIDVPAAVDARDVRDCDVLILACKTRDTLATLTISEHLRPAVALSIQNGVLKDSQLQTFFGGSVVGASTMIGARKIDDGVVEFTLDEPTFLGELDGTESDRVLEIATAFETAGLRAIATTEIQSIEWTKLALYCSGSVSALTGFPMHLVWRTPQLAEVVVALIRETAGVAAALGIELSSFDGFGFNVKALADGPLSQAIEQVTRRGVEVEQRGRTRIIPSLLQDLRSRRPTEVEETIGHVAREGERLSAPVPLTAFCHRLLAGCEAATLSGGK